MPAWVFTVSLIGTGDTQNNAWLEAVDQLSLEPGEPETAQLEDEIDDEIEVDELD